MGTRPKFAAVREAQVLEVGDWWACPTEVANAWRATRQREL